MLLSIQNQKKKKRQAFFLQSVYHFNAHSMLFFTAFVTTIATMFPICYMSDRVVHHLQMIPDKAYNSPWPELSLKQMRCIQMIIINGHVQREYYGVGLIVCSQKTLVQVNQFEGPLIGVRLTSTPFQMIRAAFSFFLLIKSRST